MVWKYGTTYRGDPSVDALARVVFGEARGEPYVGQLAVAYTVVNRVRHEAYPSSVAAVLAATWGSQKRHEYETLDIPSHDVAFNDAKQQLNKEFLSAVMAAREALCACAPDPTGCAVSFCAGAGCLQDNSYYIATNKIQIGNHNFACRVKASGK
ncbi:uncharacterized protein LOC127845920 [Dreissena polymorpha]|uniref:uncharacterized protein LOC127845920 n=1 Tax=Dreissena polymorpha TaxID=45954 RepID=UPI002265039E|nr:uncharacterized protein LOC127845920 [Dreissena polymorpha]